MRRALRLPLIYLVFLLFPLQAVTQEQPDVVIFDEDDPIGIGYYDASASSQRGPSALKGTGPSQKLTILTNTAFSGQESGAFQWTSAPKGDWRMYVARQGFKTANVTGYSSVVLYVNGPQPVKAADLPLIGLESSPPDAPTTLVKLSDFLPEGIDADPDTWQRISIPLRNFSPRKGFSLGKVKDAFFKQGASDGQTHTMWIDNVRIVGTGAHAAQTMPPAPPTDLVCRAGDRSVALHWERTGTNELAGYNLYRRSTDDGPETRLNSKPVPIRSFADVGVPNGQAQYYWVRAVDPSGQESMESDEVTATPRAFADDNEFLDYVQATAFDYFWYEANPRNGLVRDRSDPNANCSIAAVGFGLTSLGVGVDHGWISRPQAAARALATLRTFWQQPQGTNLTGTIGYRGWFYHFLDMDKAVRAGTTELSSIDTALLLAGILEAKQYFHSTDPNEAAIRSLADAIYNRVDWQWMSNGTNSLTHGWKPEAGFLKNRWIGYNEGMILYLLGMGAPTNTLTPAHWASWTSGYQWQTNYGQAFVTFPPLFGHQYSHCWVDFRGYADAYMRARGSTYFENSRRATLAQRAYCIENPRGFSGYSSNLWGLTACDGPNRASFLGYKARGSPPVLFDDGTVAPTAAGGSIPFTPEYSLPALRFLYDRYLNTIWTGYGFCDTFNLQADWWDPQVLGIDQGPILIMAENFRTGRVWKLFMQNPEIQRGLKAAGFTPNEMLASETPGEAPPDLNRSPKGLTQEPARNSAGKYYHPIQLTHP